MVTEINDNKVVISGEVSVWDAERFPIWKKNGDYYQVVDLSQAHFMEEEQCYRRSLGWSHSGPMYYGGTLTKKVNALQTLLENLHAGTVVLPADVTRKFLNVCIRSENIGYILVPDDCRLFSMKDGNIWNKKGTILIHEQRTPVFVKCEGCRRSFIASAGGKTVDGGLVCPDCQRRSDYTIGHTGTYIPFDGLYYYQNDRRLKERLSEAGTDMSSYLWTLHVRGYK